MTPPAAPPPVEGETERECRRPDGQQPGVWYCAECLQPSVQHAESCSRVVGSDVQQRICFACNKPEGDHLKGLGQCRFVLRAEAPVARLRQSLRFARDPLAMGREQLRFKDAVVSDAAEVLRLIDGGKLR